MSRNCKMFCGSGTLIVLFPLIFLNAATTTSSSDVEGAQALPSPREIQEAQKIVGQFLRNGAGTDWLSGIAKTNSTPLTTPDLMKAILRTTKQGDQVWQAATTLLNALNSTSSISSRMDLSSVQNDNWKDLIANIEMEDDIICLYRKNGNETTKRADDWKKFLKTVTPGYTVHLAIDTGRKYVICLKKIEVPETTSQVSSTTAKKPTTTINISSAIPTVTTGQSSTVAQQPSMPSAARALKKLSPEPFPEKPGSDNLCGGKQDAARKMSNNRNLPDNAGAIIGYPLYPKNSVKNGRGQNQIHRGMGNYLSPGLGIRADCSCRKSGTCDDVRDELFNIPIIFIILQPNDYFPSQSSSAMNFPFDQAPRLGRPSPCQNRRCSTKPQRSFFAAPVDPSNPINVKRSHHPSFDYVDPWQSTGGRSGIPKNAHFRPNILDERMQNEVLARRTLLRSKRPSHLGANTKSTTCLADPTRPFIGRKKNIANPMSGHGYVYSPRSIPEKYRYETSQVINNGAGQRFPPVQQINRSLRTRSYQQPIVQRPQMWDYNKLPYRKVYSPIQHSLTKPARPQRPLMQYFDRKDPNLFAFPGSQSKVPCRKPHCMQMYQKPLNYLRPKPLSLEKFDSRNHIIEFPLLYSESLLVGENSGLTDLTDIPNRLKCPKPCDKPIKLQVVINGKVQEPLDVAVLSEPGQKVDLVGFDPSMPSHRPGIPLNGVPVPTRLPDDTNTYFETEINTRMDLEKSDEKEAPLTESGFPLSNVLENETNSTTQVTIETTTSKPDIMNVTDTSIEESETQQTAVHSTTTVQTDETSTTSTTSSTITV